MHDDAGLSCVAICLTASTVNVEGKDLFSFSEWEAIGEVDGEAQRGEVLRGLKVIIWGERQGLGG
jgi:hypothetical protein